MLIDDFLKYLQIELNKSAHTVESYRHDLRQWAEFETQGQVEELRPMEATSADIRLYMSHWRLRAIRRRRYAARPRPCAAFSAIWCASRGLKAIRSPP